MTETIFYPKKLRTPLEEDYIFCVSNFDYVTEEFLELAQINFFSKLKDSTQYYHDLIIRQIERFLWGASNTFGYQAADRFLTYKIKEDKIIHLKIFNSEKTFIEYNEL